MLSIDGKQYTEEDLTPEQIAEVNHMVALQQELGALQRRFTDVQIALSTRQEAFVAAVKEAAEGPLLEEDGDSEGETEAEVA
jgi:methylphosphotriester-DNA--protein-cysteine methyltransferase